MDQQKIKDQAREHGKEVRRTVENAITDLDFALNWIKVTEADLPESLTQWHRDLSVQRRSIEIARKLLKQVLLVGKDDLSQIEHRIRKILL